MPVLDDFMIQTTANIAKKMIPNLEKILLPNLSIIITKIRVIPL